MDKKYLINHCIYLFTTLIAAVLIGYVVFHLSGSGESNPSTVIAQRLTAGETITAQGYIFKDEMPLIHEESGTLYTPLNEGEKVKTGGTIASVYQGKEEEVARLLAYDDAIALLEKSNKKTALDQIDLQLKNLTAELRNDLETGSAATAARKTALLQILLNMRKKATGTAPSFESEIALLKREKDALKAAMGEPQSIITAPAAGNYYSVCDGYEELFHSNLIDSLTIDSFIDLTERTPAKKEGPFIGKLCQSSTWYLVFFTESGTAAQMKTGKDYKLTFSDKGSFHMTLFKTITRSQGNGTLLIFKSDLVPQEGLFDRSEQVCLVANEISGLMVPTAAVRYLPPKEGENIPDSTGVYVKVGNKLVFRRIKILCESNGYYVVKEFSKNEALSKEYLALNDVIVTSGKNLEEGYKN